MLEKKRTPKAWTEYLSSEEQPVSLEEYQAGCMSRILGCLIELTQATGHLEGMVGAMDDHLARTLGPAYTSSQSGRAALAEGRRNGGLRDG